MLELEAYKTFLLVNGETQRERTIKFNRDNFERRMVDNPGYKEHCFRNGKPQRFVVDRSDVAYKYKFMAFPGEPLYAGDFIECDGECFVITEPPRVLNEFILSAIGWQCNQLFRWQDETASIVEQWGVLHSGVYSTTVTNDEDISVPDKQFKVYLPLNDNTKKLYVDKRLAIDTRYDSFGNTILEVYRITGMNSKARSYGKNAHLLVMELRSDTYSPDTDNLDELICDYKHVSQSASSPEASIIQGRTTIRIGTSRRYCSNAKELSWRVTCENEGVSYVIDGNDLVISATYDTNLIGTAVLIELLDSNGASMAQLEAEVSS